MDSSAHNPAWALIVHGGARNILPEDEQRYRDGCTRAAQAGQEVLEDGGFATEAVEAAIRVLEDDGTFNAGIGSVLNSEGVVKCDAAIMDGSTLNFGGVAAVRDLRHPISVAASLLAEEAILLVGEGAELFASERGAEKFDYAQHTASQHHETDPGCDTVGCVAMDMRGNFAAGTSTGGLRGTPPGRVGDSPLPGCGLYAENSVGAVALSGDGERIARTTLASWAMHALNSSSPNDAVERALVRLSAVEGEGGLILLDTCGRMSWAHNSPNFAVAHCRTGQPVRAFTHRDQDEQDYPAHRSEAKTQ